MPEPPLLLQREPPVATVIFNRPEARNALNEAMQLALPPMLTQLHEDADIRVLILRAIPKISTPESRHFSASNRCRRFTGDSRPRGVNGCRSTPYSTRKRPESVM